MRPALRSLRAAPLPVPSRACTWSAFSDTRSLLHEEGADALLVGDAADRLAEQVGGRGDVDPPGGPRLAAERDGVGDHQLLELRVLDAFERGAGQDGMRDRAVDAARPRVLQRAGGPGEGAGRVDHVDDDHALLTLHVA